MLCLTGFKEPAPLQAGSSGMSHLQKLNAYSKDESDQTILETQPILEPIPWEPHWVDPHI